MTKYTDSENSEKRIVKALRDGAGDIVPSDNLRKKVAQIVMENSYDKQKSEGRWNEFMNKFVLVGVAAVVVLAVGMGVSNWSQSDKMATESAQNELEQFAQNDDVLNGLEELDDEVIEDDLAQLAFLDDESADSQTADNTADLAPSMTTESDLDAQIDDLDFDLQIDDLVADDIAI